MFCYSKTMFSTLSKTKVGVLLGLCLVLSLLAVACDSEPDATTPEETAMPTSAVPDTTSMAPTDDAGTPELILGDRGPISIVGIDPLAGSTLGGTMVTVRGTGLGLQTVVAIGGVAAERVEILDVEELQDSTSLSVYTPPHALGKVDVVVTALDGESSVLEDSFTYEPPIFTDVGEKTGVDFLHYRDDKDVISIGAGVIIFDYNDDGNDDIYVTTAKTNPTQVFDSKGYNALYHNNGDGTFTDVAVEAGVSDLEGKGNGGCAADYNNDGGQDLFVSNWGSSKLFHNNLDGTFTDVTAAVGLGDPDPTYRSMGCAWGDYDRDGFLDFVVVRHVNETKDRVIGGGMLVPSINDVRALALYHNNQDGSFSEVSHLLGDTSAPGGDDWPVGNLWGAGFQPGWVDYDNDGDSDLYVVNDFGDKIQPNVLWRNDGPSEEAGWSFEDISGSSGADVAMFGMGLAVGDYNIDGHLDFFMTNMGNNVLLANDGDGLSFTDTTSEAGVGAGMVRKQDRVSWGTVFFDYDNDGDEDLYVASGFLDLDPDMNRREQPNVLFRNNGDGSFTDVSPISGADDSGVGRGVAYADFNKDGCLDLYMVNLGKAANVGERAKLFQNSCDWENNWLIIKTVGTTSNRDGIGARVSITAGGRTQIREVAAGTSDKCQNMLAVHFGLGKETMVDSVQILWPSGTVQALTDVSPNQRITVLESP